MNTPHPAFLSRALRPQIHKGRCWIAYGLNGTATVIPEEELLADKPELFSQVQAGTFNPADPANPFQGKAQILCDYLEKFSGSICVMAELKDARWLGRCSAMWLGYTDATDWHEANSPTDLMRELVDAYGD